jgi:VCBS repeat-containing protein
MIVVTGSVTAKPDTFDEVRRLSLEHVHRSRTEPGCLLHSVHQNVEDPNVVVFVEHWEDGDALTAAIVATSTHGALTLNANGSFTYTPASNYFGADSFTYRASDGTANSGVATVSLTITNINRAPVATDERGPHLTRDDREHGRHPLVLPQGGWQGCAAEQGACDRQEVVGIAKAVGGTANYITAAICKMTGNQPASACTSTVQSLESSLK